MELLTSADLQADQLDPVPSQIPPDLYGEEVVAASPGIYAALVVLLRAIPPEEGRP